MSEKLTVKSMTKTCEKYDIKVTDSIRNFFESIERCPRYNRLVDPFTAANLPSEHLCSLCLSLNVGSIRAL